MQEGEIGDGAFDFGACASSRRGTASVKWDTPSEEGVLPLWVADMDFRVAPAIVEALRRRVDDGVFGYALPPPAWHESLSRWLSRRHGLTVAPDAILDATGVIPALAAVLRAICGHDGKVVIQTPVYGSFFTTIRNQGLEIVESPLRRVPARNAADGDFTYEMDFDDLERKVSVPGVRLFLLCNPHNPVGRAWTAEELRRAGEICLRHGVFIASDEIHADLQMPGSRHVPFAGISEGFAASSVTFWSASKAFNLAGLQTSAVVCVDRDVRERIRRAIRVHCVGELNSFGFIASSVAWDSCADWLDELRVYLQGNFRAMLGFLRARLPQCRVTALEATYLAWVDMTAFGVPSAELERRLEREAKVRFANGAQFGEPAGTSFLRVNLACSRATLLEALERLATWCAGIAAAS